MMRWRGVSKSTERPVRCDRNVQVDFSTRHPDLESDTQAIQPANAAGAGKDGDHLPISVLFQKIGR